MDLDQKPENKIYSVDEITTYIKLLLTKDKNLQNIWIKGEISNFKLASSGHMYFSLKDENSLINCVMFRGTNKDLQFQPKEGMKILIKGNVDIYKKTGNYQIIIEEMHLDGQGELYLKFLQLKEKLEKEGLFNKIHKKPIPKYPKIIGIITSLQGAVIQDIIKITKRRYPHVKLLVYPSAVQGDQAKDNIVSGITILNTLELDLIILARGGGSFEDLFPFSEEIVARAIYDSKIPIISAVGHETDFSIADFVADLRAPTPSAAAEIAVPDEQEILKLFSQLERNLCNRTRRILEIRRQKIDFLINRPLFKRPYLIIEEHRQNLDELIIHIKKTVLSNIELLKSELLGVEGKLNALNPEGILNRGYSITMKKSQIITSIKDINTGEIISTIVKDGEIISEVQNKNGK